MLKHNTMMRFLSICMVAVLLLGTFIGCSKDQNEQPSDDSSTQTSEEKWIVCQDGEAKTQIVFSATSGRTMRDVAVNLQSRLKEVTGVSIPFVGDNEKMQKGEIVLGATSHISSCPELAESETLIQEIDGCVLLLAGGEMVWKNAIELLISNLKQEGTTWYFEKGLSERKVAENFLSLRVATYNIHLGGKDVKYDLSVLANDILDTGADIIGLQEVDQNTQRNKNQDTMKILGELTGYYYYFAPAEEMEGGQYGNGILSKYPIETVDYVVLPDTGVSWEETRVVLQAQINVNGAKFYFYVTHFNQSAADISMKKIYSIAKSNDPFILVGDFNFEDFDVFDANFPGCTKVNNANVNFHTTYDSGYKFDNIILSPSVVKTKSWLIDTTDETGKPHSDHMILVANIKIVFPI